MLLVSSGIDVRDYQRNIAASALEKNTLVVLPTGLGKTVVALLVARERLAAFPTGRVLFLAPTRPLVIQHSEFFKTHLSEIASTVLTGETVPSLRVELFETSRIIFATPEVIRNDISKGRYSLRDVCLIIFDEAHRCVRDYAYSQVAEAYKLQSSSPRILGLTASPSSRKSRIDEICQRLAIEGVEARTEVDDDVSGYVNPVAVNWERVALPPVYDRISSILRKVLDEKIERLQNLHLLPKSVNVNKRTLLELGDSIRKKLRTERAGYLYGALVLQSQGISLFHAVEMVETQGVRSVTRFLSRLDEKTSRSSLGLAKDPRVIEALKLCEENIREEHPKNQSLRRIITSQLAEKPESKLIVFTQFRDTADLIVDGLKNIPSATPVRFVGQATRNMDDIGLKQEQQVQILDDFKTGRYNVLVTTSIGEEGLHVPDVDHVIFYEAVPSEIRMIQRRGRTGRTKPGKVTVLMAEGTVDEAYFHSSRRKERDMHRHLAAFKKDPSPGKRKTTLLDYSSPAN